ncbi:MAG: hypothetical protein IBX50_18700 [Marinospirillum sp.]|uniref:hypothetical protein n=1 Tax=Marinospirillum sp. TaxID=2183934 RepID=UPI0019F9FCBB|nr:hypothetical protein [Marinospirillum sp.]MBE0508718.1 hypothetical protein [Marinospirillum sp.]
MTHKKQQGFILALALLMMLFVGLVVITSTERTGQETRISQSDAPTATLQAAAEAGLLMLRQQVNYITRSGQSCNNIGNFNLVCGCINDISLAALFNEHPYRFNHGGGFSDIYWWFEKSDELFSATYYPKDPYDPSSEEICILNAKVFVGIPAENPSYYMSGSIAIKISEVDIVGDLFDLDESKGFQDLTVDDLEKFYGDLSFLDGGLFSAQVIGNNGTLDPSSLRDDRINIVVVNGILNVTPSASLAGKQFIIVSNSSESFYFNAGSTGGGDSTGQGQGGGGIEGWIIAPDSTMQMGQGIPSMKVNVNVNGCRSTASGNSIDCFGNQGGSSFDGSFGSDKFNQPGAGSNDESTNFEVDASRDMKMDFNY